MSYQTKSPKTCVVNGCNKKQASLSYCSKHYSQLKKHGRILNRTIYDPNDIINHGDYVSIVMYNKKCLEVGRATISVDDLVKVEKYKWRLNSEGYAVGTLKTSNGYKTILMHRLIMNPETGVYVDHINHDTLDNRRHNLRLVNASQNQMNRKRGANNKSGRTGVYWKKDKCKWVANIRINGKATQLGSFNSFEDACKVREKAERDLFKDYRFC